MNTETCFDLDRLLAIKQMVHFMHLKQSAIDTGDKAEFRRTTDIIDKMATEYGVLVLHEAQEQYK